MRSSSNVYNILTVTPKGHTKTLTVYPKGGASISLQLHRFSLVGKGDQIRLGVAGNAKIFVVPRDGRDKDIPVTPIFSAEDAVSIGKEKFNLQIREIYSAADMRALEFLEQFHYKTNNTLREKDIDDNTKSPTAPSNGRRAVLYASIKMGERWIPAGYIELQMPLMMCKPRHELFDHPFEHPDRKIAWDKWDQQAMKSYLNTIVRIGRIVVSPELRGLGLTRYIIKVAKLFL